MYTEYQLVHKSAMQLSTIILSVLKSKRGKIHLTELLLLVRGYYASYSTGRAPADQEIVHALDLLVDDSAVIKTHNGAWEEFQISNKGYAKLRAWYAPKRVMSVISNDFAKILSIIATILSIFATILSIKARY